MMMNDADEAKLVAELEERIRTAQQWLDELNGGNYDQYIDDNSCEEEAMVAEELSEARVQLRFLRPI